MNSFRMRAEIYREFGWRWERRNRKPYVICHMSARFNPIDSRCRPMLAWECRKPGGLLWAFEGTKRWGPGWVCLGNSGETLADGGRLATALASDF